MYKRFVRHLRKTWKQKLCAMALAAVGVLSAMLSEGDATALIIMLFIAVPMFFSNRTDWIV